MSVGAEEPGLGGPQENREFRSSSSGRRLSPAAANVVSRFQADSWRPARPRSFHHASNQLQRGQGSGFPGSPAGIPAHVPGCLQGQAASLCTRSRWARPRLHTWTQITKTWEGGPTLHSHIMKFLQGREQHLQRTPPGPSPSVSLQTLQGAGLTGVNHTGIFVRENVWPRTNRGGRREKQHMSEPHAHDGQRSGRMGQAP